MCSSDPDGFFRTRALAFEAFPEVFEKRGSKPPTQHPNRGTADYDGWTSLIRELGCNDPERMRQIVRWTVREAVLAYLKLLQQAALEHHRTNLLVWASRTAFGGGVKPPDVPKILQP